MDYDKSASNVNENEYQDENESELWHKVENRITLAAGVLSLADRVVFSKLRIRCGFRNGECFETIEKMAESIGISDKQFRLSLKKLESLNIISRKLRFGKPSITRILHASKWNLNAQEKSVHPVVSTVKTETTESAIRKPVPNSSELPSERPLSIRLKRSKKEIPIPEPKEVPVLDAAPVLTIFAQPETFVSPAEVIKKPRVRKPAAEKPDGSILWDAFSKAVERRHGRPPSRGKTTNLYCSQILSEVSLERACILADLFVSLNHYEYTRKFHDIYFFKRDIRALDMQADAKYIMTAKISKEIEKNQDDDQISKIIVDELSKSADTAISSGNNPIAIEEKREPWQIMIEHDRKIMQNSTRCSPLSQASSGKT